MDAEREKALDDALARARAAFADKTEEQILEEVVELIERMRADSRKGGPSLASA